MVSGGDNMELIKIGNYINKCRRAQKITQEQLGEKLGVSFQAVSNWEQGKNLPDASLLLDLAICLDTTVDNILKGGTKANEDQKIIRVKDIIQGIDNLASIKELLGKDNTFYKYMVEGISKGMNTNFEEAIESNYLREFLVIEILIQNSYTGHYIDHDEVRNLLTYEKTKNVFFEYIKKKPENFNSNDLIVNL